jgi:DNA gyrase subunit A
LANIDEVVQLIKSSTSTAAAREGLCKRFLLTEAQAKHILDMKLSKLAKLEVQKIENEKKELEKQAEKIKAILNDENLLKAEIEKGMRAVANKYGDPRRTKIMDVEKEDDEEPTEIKQLQISLTNKNNIFITETSTLYTQKRGGVGNKLRLEEGEFVIDTQPVASNEELMFFTSAGNVCHYSVRNLTFGEKIYVKALINLPDWENVCAITSANKKTQKPYILFFTKKGMVKKSEITEYNMARKAALKALTLDDGDEIVNVLFLNEEKVGILTESGNFIIIETADIPQ